MHDHLRTKVQSGPNNWFLIIYLQQSLKFIKIKKVHAQFKDQTRSRGTKTEQKELKHAKTEKKVQNAALNSTFS